MKKCDNEKENIAIAQQKANVSVPVSVKPRVNTKDAIMYSFGDPVLKQNSCQCEYCQKSYRFVLSQNICIEIPIEFSVDTTVGNAYIDCIKIMEEEKSNVL